VSTTAGESASESTAAEAHSPGQQRRIGSLSRGRRAAETGADPVPDGVVVTDLVTRARTGDQQAWDTLVERYAPLIWSICCRYRLGADADDIGQSVWLRLVGQLGKIRDPAALPGWLATTTRRECQAGHPDREHRAHPPPLPGQAAPPSCHRRHDRYGQRRGMRLRQHGPR